MSAQNPGRIRRAIHFVRTEPGLLRNVIAVVVVVALGLGIGGTVLANQRFTPPWQGRTQVWATFAEAASVAPGLGQSVQINGVEVGQIADAKIDNKGHALVLMSINQDTYDRPIYQNATVVMRPTTPLNTMYIEMDPGGPPAPEVPDYGVLPLGSSQSPIEIDQPLSHLDENTREATRALLSQADVALARAGQDLPGGVSAVDDFTKQVTPVVQELDTRRDKIKQLITAVGQLSQAVGGNDVRLTNLANSLQKTLQAVSDRSNQLRDSFNQLPGVTHSLQASTGAVQGLSDQLDPTLDDIKAASDTLPDSLGKLTDTVDTASTTVDKLAPVAQKLKPTAADLRPFVDDVNHTLPELKPVVRQLDPITGNLIPYLPDLTAFVYQVRSITDLGDQNGRNSARALVQASTCSVPVSNPLCTSTPATLPPDRIPTPPPDPSGSGGWGDHKSGWGDHK
jgi:phospholipid/cholesterol/gamma-HCH transport system substrate-binding protein